MKYLFLFPASSLPLFHRHQHRVEATLSERKREREKKSDEVKGDGSVAIELEALIKHGTGAVGHSDLDKTSLSNNKDILYTEVLRKARVVKYV